MRVIKRSKIRLSRWWFLLKALFQAYSLRITVERAKLGCEEVEEKINEMAADYDNHSVNELNALIEDYNTYVVAYNKGVSDSVALSEMVDMVLTDRLDPAVVKLIVKGVNV